MISPLCYLNHVRAHNTSTSINALAIIACSFISTMLDDESLTSTDCGPLTRNWIGTISAANNIKVISLVWQMIVMTTYGIRVFNAICYLKFATRKPQSTPLVCASWISSISFCLECFFLLMIAVVPSNELLDVHCCMFLSFAFFAMINQASKMREFKLNSKHSHEAALAYKKLKKVIIVGTILLFVAIFFSFLHFVSCVSGAYSLFAAFEYLYVLFGNIRFHSQSLAAYDELNRAQFFTPLRRRSIGRGFKDKPIE